MSASCIRCIEDSTVSRMKSRKTTAGPEADMVNCFLYKQHNLKRLINNAYDAVVFIEPRIDSGFPDIVLVQYNEGKLGKWSSLRNFLEPEDLKVLANILVHRPSKRETIAARSGFSLARIDIALELLSECRLVEEIGNHLWKGASKSSFFGIERIVAIEAKVNNANKAIHQALYNQRFSTESYILLQSKSASLSIVDKCSDFGIGIISDSGSCIQLEALQSRLPINHVSLQFNEWLTEFIYKGERNEI